MIQTDETTNERFILEENEHDLKSALHKIIASGVTELLYFQTLSHVPLHKSMVIEARAGAFLDDCAKGKHGEFHFTTQEVSALQRLSDGLYELLDAEDFFAKKVFLRKASVLELCHTLATTVKQCSMQDEPLERSIFTDEERFVDDMLKKIDNDEA